MRRHSFYLVSALVLLLLSGPALSASAAVSRTEAPHHRARHLRAATALHHTASAHPAHLRMGRGARLHGRAAIAVRRRPAPVATAREDLSAAIPSVPLKHWALLPPMVGSHESLVRQNTRTEADGLTRIEDDAQLNALRRTNELVAVPVSAQLRVNEGLPANRRYCRPWTAKFLVDLARAHAMRFRRSLQVNSAVRTVAYQRSLMEVNGNAAPADGDIASPHLTGATIDIAKKGLSMSEVAWMRAYLLPLEQAGRIDVEEEFYQSCFHITVYKSYAGTPGAPRVSSSLLASRVR